MIGATSLGANRRNASRGSATPMPTPTSTSVGASTPNAMRATATTATRKVATHLPRLRQRPSGTSVYNTDTRVAARKATGCDGIAQAPQLVRSSTPNGRGRRAAIATRPMITLPTCEATTHTIRCRQRRNTSRPRINPQYSVPSTHQNPMRTRPRRGPTTPGPTTPASQPTTASPTTVTATAGPRSPRPKIARVSPTSTSAATSQPTPLVCSRYGNGGAAPVGRRRCGDRTASRRVGCSGGALVDVDWPEGTSMAPPNRGQLQPGQEDLVC